VKAQNLEKMHLPFCMEKQHSTARELHASQKTFMSSRLDLKPVCSVAMFSMPLFEKIEKFD